MYLCMYSGQNCGLKIKLEIRKYMKILKVIKCIKYLVIYNYCMHKGEERTC